MLYVLKLPPLLERPYTALTKPENLALSSSASSLILSPILSPFFGPAHIFYAFMSRQLLNNTAAIGVTSIKIRASRHS